MLVISSGRYFHDATLTYFFFQNTAFKNRRLLSLAIPTLRRREKKKTEKKYKRHLNSWGGENRSNFDSLFFFYDLNWPPWVSRVDFCNTALISLRNPVTVILMLMVMMKVEEKKRGRMKDARNKHSFVIQKKESLKVTKTATIVHLPIYPRTFLTFKKSFINKYCAFLFPLFSSLKT